METLGKFGEAKTLGEGLTVFPFTDGNYSYIRILGVVEGKPLSLTIANYAPPGKTGALDVIVETIADAKGLLEEMGGCLVRSSPGNTYTD
jgi:hypothetical protein